MLLVVRGAYSVLRQQQPVLLLYGFWVSVNYALQYTIPSQIVVLLVWHRQYCTIGVALLGCPVTVNWLEE